MWRRNKKRENAVVNREMLSSLKLQYYPTDVMETWRILGLVGGLSIGYEAKQKCRAELEPLKTLAKEKYKLETNYAIDNMAEKLLYFKMLDEKRYGEIEKLFSISPNMRDPSSYRAGQRPLIVVDLFAGEGKWLSLFKEMAKERRDVYLIANEIEEGRYKAITDNSNIDESHNLAFEELELPKHSINLMLFNPPYTNVGGERSAVIYLQDIVERQLLTRSGYLTKSVVALVLRDSDMDKCAPLIIKNFDVLCLYRTDEQAYKQFVCIASSKEKARSKSLTDVAQHMQDIDEFKGLLRSNPIFDPAVFDGSVWYEAVDYQTAKSNLVIAKTEVRIESDPDDTAWRFVKDLTRFSDETKLAITMPRAPKLGEVANLLAAGQLNSEMSMPDGKGDHVVIGGTKVVEQTMHEDKLNKKGESEDNVIIIKKHEPFLNILVINECGTPEIIELTEHADEESGGEEQKGE